VKEEGLKKKREEWLNLLTCRHTLLSDKLNHVKKKTILYVQKEF